MRLALASCLLLAGCHLDDLLDPGPPPDKCFRTYRFRVIQQQDADTAYFVKSVEVPCDSAKQGGLSAGLADVTYEVPATSSDNALPTES